MTFPSLWEEDRYYLTLSFIYIVIHVIQRRQYMYVLYDDILYLDEYMPWALNQTHLVSTAIATPVVTATRRTLEGYRKSATREGN